MVFGTFDVLHKGHDHFFKQARKLAKNPYLIVSVARDVNVKRIKGKKPLHSERQRAAALRKNHFIDRVVLGNVQGYISHIKKEKPAIIALGYDQEAYTMGLEDKTGIAVVRLKPHKPHLYKSSLIKNRK
jgi:FAD synthetase